VPADSSPRLSLSREQILAHRRAVGDLDERLPPGPDSLRRAAWAGLQDSMPRAALLSIHARVEATTSTAWADPPLVQTWGPRFSAYVIAETDLAIFTLGRLPDDGPGRRVAELTAARLHEALDGRVVTAGEAGAALGVHPNALRYGASTGRILIRWDGARRPTVWTVPAPDLDPREARLELARRYLHLFGPTTDQSFSTWAGISPAAGRSAFAALGAAITPARTPIGDGWILTADEPGFTADGGHTAPAVARLLPSGDTYFLLQGADRELLVPDAAQRNLLWTPRVWPGAVLVNDEVVGTWRRSQAQVTVELWRRLSSSEQDSVEAEAVAMPLPGLEGRLRVQFDQAGMA
jgi:hypothetical protein